MGNNNEKQSGPPSLDKMSKDELKNFQKSVRKELRDSIRQVDREMLSSDRLIKSSKRDLEKKIKEGASKQVIRMYAKNCVQAEKTKEKHMMNKTKIQNVEYSMNQLITNVKMGQIMGSTTEIMKNINQLANIPEISKTINGVQMQMEKHGIINEMMEDVMEDVGDDDIDIDDRARELIDNLEDKIGVKKVKQGEKVQVEDTSLDAQIQGLSL